ncbi:MAG: hypothetical protein U1F10_16665 [Burkholderiales bacterium]
MKPASPRADRRAPLAALARFAFLAGLAALLVPQALALPSFARQTGQQCAACHVGGDWPQLTPWGRIFKLTGYTAGSAFVSKEGFDHVPVGVFGQLGVTWAKAPDDSQGNPVVTPNGAFRGEQFVGYYGGKIADFAGVFYEYQYGNNYPGWSGATGVFDARAVNFYHPGDGELLVGLDLNNGPSNQDVWNTVPAWAYPFYGSPIAPGAPASTMLSTVIGQSGGVGVYALWNRKLYAEISAYRVGTGFWRWATIGTAYGTQGGADYLSGYNPYWRFFYNDESGPHNWMIGTFGMVSNVYPNNLVQTGPTDRYTDYYVDAQYQYLEDESQWTLRGTWYYERQSFGGSYPQGLSSTPTGNLNGITISGTYTLRNAWSFSAAYFQSNGSDNADLYAVTGPTGNVLSASPNTSGYYLQANWIPTQNLKLQLQYSGFLKFNGLTGNIDGMGRSPADNNTLWFNVFFAI